MKKSFVIYSNWAVIADNLPEELAGQLFKAICAMQLGHDYEIKDPAIKALFISISDKMDEDAKSYEDTKKKRAGAVKARWDKEKEDSEPIQTDAKAYKSIQTDTNGYKTIQNDTNVSRDDTNGYKRIQTDSVTGTVTGTGTGTVTGTANGTVKETGNLKVAKRDIAAKAAHSFTPPTEDEVRDYCRTQGYTHVEPDSFVNFYGSKGWMVGKTKMVDWHKAVAGWESREKREKARSGTTTGLDYLYEMATGGAV